MSFNTEIKLFRKTFEYKGDYNEHSNTKRKSYKRYFYNG